VRLHRRNRISSPHSVENISKTGPLNCRSLHYAPPDFLLTLVALMHFMRPSLRKGAHAALSSVAWQEIRVRFGRDDKGETGASTRNQLVDGGNRRSLGFARDDKG